MILLTHEMKYSCYLPKKYFFILLQATCNVSPTEKGGGENIRTSHTFCEQYITKLPNPVF